MSDETAVEDESLFFDVLIFLLCWIGIVRQKRLREESDG